MEWKKDISHSKKNMRVIDSYKKDQNNKFAKKITLDFSLISS